MSGTCHPVLSGQIWAVWAVWYILKEGDILRWIVERTDGTTTEIRVNQKESNQY
ncbi:MAG: hypothetical protein ACLSTI_04285 [Ruminococcus sp.]